MASRRPRRGETETNTKLIVAILLAFALTACNGAVLPATAEPTAVIPTEVPPTAVPSPAPTREPTATPTEVPTEVPTPTPTPFALPALDEWAAANSFQRDMGDGEYYDSINSDGTSAGFRSRIVEYCEKKVGNGIAFWVEDREYENGYYPPVRTVAVTIPNSAPRAMREDALNAWAKNLSELFMPAVAEWVAGLTFVPVPDGDPTFIWIDGYNFYYGAWDMGGGDTAFYVYGSPGPPPPPVLDYELPFELLEAVAPDCSAVVPTNLQGEEFDSWTDQYLKTLFLEALGQGDSPPSLEVFLLPSGCLVALYLDAVGGDHFLIYETAEGVVKVPYEPPPVP